ncbi:MAG: MmgE/PrpD family protein, partial [Clostridiales bacterium]|nr:MmgE/PrpD family protein [Clostridiales bacterium]
MIDHIDSLDPAPYAQDARLCLLDALGCVLYGATLRDGAAVIDGVYGFGAGKVPLPASDKSFTPDACALVMGALCHLRELDDVHVSIIHPGACVVPAAWSAAYFLDQSLDALTAAIFAGYEAAVRISEASGFLAHR